MDIVGIIAEYNPFHNGHAYMLARVRQKYPSAGIVVVMSGSVTERGEVTVADKWRRSRMAVQSGADLVLELPTAFVLSSAQNFALGGVALLNKLGCVNKLAFGAEFCDITALRQAANYMDSAAGQEKITAQVLDGHAYAAAARRVLAEYTPVGKPQPNTVLAVEYLRAVNKLGAPLEPVPIERNGAAHLDTVAQDAGTIASATAVRKMLLSGQAELRRRAQQYLPPFAAGLLCESEFAVTERLYTAFLSRLATMSAPEIAAHIGVGEGLEQRLLQVAQISGSLMDFVNRAAGKRYGTGRIGRVIMGLLLGFTAADQQRFLRKLPLYARVLAFNTHGRGILRRIKTASDMPLITRVGPWLNRRDWQRDETTLSDGQQMLKLDIKATLLRGLALPVPKLTCSDYLTSPVYLP